MAVVFQTVGIKTNDPDSNNWNVDCGSTIQLGDLLIIGLAWRANSCTFTPATTGWNTVQNLIDIGGTTMGLYWKLADGQEAGGSTLNVSSGNITRGTLSLMRLTGAAAVSTISQPQYISDGGTVATLAAITFGSADGMIYSLTTSNSNSTNVFTTNNGNVTVSERVDSNPTSNASMAVATFAWSGVSSGSTAVTATRTSGTGDMQLQGIYIAPAVPVGPANVKTLNGIAAADVKTWNGVPWSDIKTFNGIT